MKVINEIATTAMLLHANPIQPAFHARAMSIAPSAPTTTPTPAATPISRTNVAHSPRAPRLVLRQPDEDQYERQGDSVIETRLDVEGLTDPLRDSPVRDHSLPQRSVHWRHDGSDDRRLLDAEIGEQDRGEHGAEPDRQGQSDAEQPAWEHCIAAP